MRIINCISIQHRYLSYKIFKKLTFNDEEEFYRNYPNPRDKLVVQTATRLDIYFYDKNELQYILNFIRRKSYQKDFPYLYYEGRDAMLYLLKCLCRIESRTLSESYLDTIIRYNYNRFKNNFSPLFKNKLSKCLDIATKYMLKNEIKYKIYEKIKNIIKDKKILIYGVSRSALYLSKLIPKDYLRIYHKNRRLLRILYGKEMEKCFIENLDYEKDIDIFICATLASHERINEEFFKNFKKKVYVIDISPFKNFKLKDEKYVKYDHEIRDLIEKNYEDEINKASSIAKKLLEIVDSL